MNKHLLFTSIVLALAGCGGGDSSNSTQNAPADADPIQSTEAHTFGSADAPIAPNILRDSSLDEDTAASATTANKAALPGYVLDTRQREAVRLFYQAVYGSSANIASGWNGNLAACNAGTTSAEYQAATLRRINWFRAMAGVPAAIELDPTFTRKAQSAAMLMAANKALSHTPPTSWTCYNADAAEAAGKSNIGLGNAGYNSMIDGYIRDAGSNNAAVGHRRWLLNPPVRMMGVGYADAPDVAASAVWIFDGNQSGARPVVRDEYVAWPPAGFVPYPSVYPRWSFGFPGADFSSTTVSMTQNGAAIPTRKEALKNGASDNTLVWFPDSYVDGSTWARPTQDTTYRVTLSNVLVNGVARTFTYDVTVFDPQIATTSITLNGPDALNNGQTGSYSFAQQAGADAYQWRSVHTAPYSLSDGAEAGTVNFSASTTPGYAVVLSGTAATGSNSFHLAHAKPVAQTLTLSQVLVPNANTRLNFNSRLSYATPGQHAVVEVSADEGKTWSAVYDEAGANAYVAGFSPKAVSLSAYAGKAIRVRFNYQYLTGSYYSSTSNIAGWFIDDIAITGTDVVTSSSAPVDIAVAAPPAAPVPPAPLFSDGAETGLTNMTAQTTAGYDVVISSPVAGGSKAFHLAQPKTLSQILQVKQALRVNATTELRFASRLGYATVGQKARVEVSNNNGASWSPVFEQAGYKGGTGAIETAYSSKVVSLAAYAGQTVLVRFHYIHTGGSYFPQTTTNVGWLIDNISVVDTSLVATPSAPAPTGPLSFSYTKNGTGTLLLQARPGMYGYHGDWGTLKTVR